MTIFDPMKTVTMKSACAANTRVDLGFFCKGGALGAFVQLVDFCLPFSLEPLGFSGCPRA